MPTLTRRQQQVVLMLKREGYGFESGDNFGLWCVGSWEEDGGKHLCSTHTVYVLADMGLLGTAIQEQKIVVALTPNGRRLAAVLMSLHQDDAT